MKNRLAKLLKTEYDQVKKLNTIVLKSVEEEKLLSQRLIDVEDCVPTLGERISDKVANFGGSWKFICLFMAIMAGWIVLNIFFLRNAFDPYPFILLNLILSTIAALQAPVIMMSQNRKESKDRQRGYNDYMINLKSEIEIRNMHEKLDLLIAEQMKTMFDLQKEQLSIMSEIKNLVDLKKNTV